MHMPVDIDVDWNTQDDTGLPWTFLDEAVHPEHDRPLSIRRRRMGERVAVAGVVDVTEDGVVHLRDVAGSLEQNLHLVRPDKPVA